MKSKGVLLVIFISVINTILCLSSKIITAKEDANLYEFYRCSSEFSNLQKDLGKQCVTDLCGRRVIDGVFEPNDIIELHSIVKKGMSKRPNLGGPTILDINTGYLRDSQGLENLFAKEGEDVYSSSDFQHYGQIIEKLKQFVMSTFSTKHLYFTAPTFITRLDGREGWEPSGIHDEYWHSHVDMNNTAHYHYSGLLYMSTYENDFTGGRLLFPEVQSIIPGEHDEERNELVIEPRSGRLVIFTSGPENPHQVERLLSGQRFVLSFWFTCNFAREFEIFLDGKAHVSFSKKVKARYLENQKQKAAAAVGRDERLKQKRAEKGEL